MMIRQVYIYQDDMLRLNAAVEKWPDIETGGFMLGTISGGGIVRIEEVFAPNIDIIRRGASLEVGGKGLAEIVDWKLDNFFNKLRPRLAHYQPHWKFEVVGYWHSHHRIGLGNLSGRDISSMEERLKDGLSIQIWPLANVIAANYTFGADTRGLIVRHDSGVHWTFFGLWPEKIKGWRNTGPVQVPYEVLDPQKGERVRIPLSWKFSQSQLYLSDMRKLKDWECKVLERTNNDPGELWLQNHFVIRHKSWKRQLVISTPWNFPQVQPVIKTISVDTPKGEPVPERVYNWCVGDSLSTIVLNVQHRGGLS